LAVGLRRVFFQGLRVGLVTLVLEAAYLLSQFVQLLAELTLHLTDLLLELGQLLSLTVKLASLTTELDTASIRLLLPGDRGSFGVNLLSSLCSLSALDSRSFHLLLLLLLHQVLILQFLPLLSQILILVPADAN